MTSGAMAKRIRRMLNGYKKCPKQAKVGLSVRKVKEIS